MPAVRVLPVKYNGDTVKDTPIQERTLNDEQRQAVEFGNGPLLIIAGAGTGKTTVVTERIKHLITSGRAGAQEILGLTFTEKASREMEERIDQAMPYGLPEMWLSTFHAFCDRILRAEAIQIGIDPGYVLMTEAETVSFFRRHLFSFDLEYFRPLGNPTKFISAMLTHFDRLRDEDVSPEEYAKFVARAEKEANTEEEVVQATQYRELSAAFRHYEELKLKEGVCDYADLISWTLRLFRQRANVLKRYRDQFKYILVDEFQDTNFAQNELAILLSGRERNITVVGDDDQAIYRWRGAAIANVLDFRRRFPDAAAIVLTRNYRSTKEILDRSYDLIQHNNPDRLEVAEHIQKKLESMRRVNGKPVRPLYAERVEDEAAEVARVIRSLTSGKDAVYTFADIAILVRANNHADPFVLALSRAGIPYQFLGPGQLFRQGEVKDLIAYLKLLYNPHDSVAAYRLLSMEFFDVSSRDVAVMFAFAREYGISLYEVMERIAGPVPDGGEDAGEPLKPGVSRTTAGKVGRLVGMIRKHLEAVRRETAGQILYYFLEDSGLLKSFTSYDSVREEKAANNIAKFFNKLKTYENDHDDAGVHAVVDWIELSMTLGESPAASDTDWTENDAVNIMTVHSAKGLEFPVVFLVNLVSARFPTAERREKIPVPDGLIKEQVSAADHHMQEERRLFYVGMTRARDLLYLTGAKFYGEGKRQKKLSPFIAEALGDAAVPQAVTVTAPESVQMSLLDWKKKPEPELKPKAGQRLRTVSYSRLETFETCPLQYKYRYVLKIPVPPAAALTFGDTIHRTVKAFYEQVKVDPRTDLTSLLSIYKSCWSPKGFGNNAYEEKMFRHGEDLLTQFYEKGFDRNRIPRDLERPFRIKVSPYLQVSGKIDRVDELPDGTLEIIDYKTGKAPKSKSPAKDLQLTVYALAATDKGLYGKLPDQVLVSFYFFEGQEKITATRTAEDLAAARQEIADRAAAIERSDFPAKPGMYCDFCEFRLICEAWK